MPDLFWRCSHSGKAARVVNQAPVLEERLAAIGSGRVCRSEPGHVSRPVIFHCGGQGGWKFPAHFPVHRRLGFLVPDGVARRPGSKRNRGFGGALALRVDRGTSRVERMGWKWAVDNVQRKRNLALLAQERGIHIPFDRRKLLKTCPLSTRYLLRFAHGFSRRMLRYNYWLFINSTPPHKRYAALQYVVRLFGPRALRCCSKLWNWVHPMA